MDGITVNLFGICAAFDFLAWRLGIQYPEWLPLAFHQIIRNDSYLAFRGANFHEWVFQCAASDNLIRPVWLVAESFEHWKNKNLPDGILFEVRRIELSKIEVFKQVHDEG